MDAGSPHSCAMTTWRQASQLAIVASMQGRTPLRPAIDPAHPVVQVHAKRTTRTPASLPAIALKHRLSGKRGCKTSIR